MSRPKVTNIALAALKREFPDAVPARTEAARLLDLPENGYVRYSVTTDAAPANSDPIELRPEFQAALLRMYAEFGVPLRVPETYGELMGACSYCAVLFKDTTYPRISAEDDAMWLKAVEAMRAECSPELLPSVRAYRNGDKAELERIGREFLTPQVLSWHYVEAYQGWAGDPYLRAHGIPAPVQREQPEKNQPRMRLVE